jgi:hypothetical protein
VSRGLVKTGGKVRLGWLTPCQEGAGLVPGPDRYRLLKNPEIAGAITVNGEEKPMRALEKGSRPNCSHRTAHGRTPRSIPEVRSASTAAGARHPMEPRARRLSLVDGRGSPTGRSPIPM